MAGEMELLLLHDIQSLQMIPVSIALTLPSDPCKVRDDVLSHADCPISRTALPPRSRASDSPVSAASTPECPLVAARSVATLPLSLTSAVVVSNRRDASVSLSLRL
jgi:hypothetical protein